MSATKYSNSGFRSATRLGPPVRVRLLGFVLLVLSGSVVLGWLTRSTWVQLQRLQKEHAAVRSEMFYLGVTLRSTIRGLNGKLLQYGLTKDPAARKEFMDEAADLELRIQTNRVQFAEAPTLTYSIGLSRDRELLQKIEKDYAEYLVSTAPVLSEGEPPPDLDTFEEVYAKVQSASTDLLALCQEFVRVQSKAFNDFLAETQRTLINHQRLLKTTSGLIVGLAAVLALLVYRGMLAPLLRGLTQSTKIIERQEKLASLGVLASGVAHEIRNPLTAIKFRLFSLQKSVPNNADATIIADEINRLEKIVKNFLRFARPSEPELVVTPAENLLREVVELLAGQLARLGIQVRVQPQSTGLIHADPQQLKQVLINLVQNAADSIGRNGTIRLSARRDSGELEGRNRATVVLSVADNGKGISPEIEDRLFDPFFTTKEGGTGLGLALAARIVEKHGGMLRYETEVNRGTTFELILPAVEDEKS